MVLKGYYPTDIRVFKEAKSLLSIGYKITLLCLRRKNEVESEFIDGINIVRIKAGYNRWGIGLWDIFIAVFGVHTLFYNGLKRINNKDTIDAIHVHDLYLMSTGLRFARQYRIPFVSDFHENLPEAFKVWFSWNKNWLIGMKNRCFFGYKKWLKREKKAAERSDIVIVTVDEMKQRFVEKLGINPDKICIVLNSELRSFVEQPLDIDIYGGDNWFRVTYTGNMGPHRGVDTAIKAMKYLKGKPICLHLVGSCSKHVGVYLDELIHIHGLEEQVIRVGYVPFAKFYSYMKFAQVNIIPHKRNEHTDNTIPHKLFQAMMTGNPVLVSSSPPLARIVGECNSGLVFEASNPKDMADKLIELMSDRVLCKELGNNGLQETLNGKWNWENTDGELLKAYKTLL